MRYEPRNPHSKRALIEVLVGRSERFVGDDGGRTERNAQNQKDRDIDANVVHGMVHGDAGISNLHLFDRQERHDPVQFALVAHKERTAKCRLKAEKERRHQVVHSVAVPVAGDVAEHYLQFFVRKVFFFEII